MDGQIKDRKVVVAITITIIVRARLHLGVSKMYPFVTRDALRCPARVYNFAFADFKDSVC